MIKQEGRVGITRVDPHKQGEVVVSILMEGFEYEEEQAKCVCVFELASGAPSAEALLGKG